MNLTRAIAVIGTLSAIPAGAHAAECTPALDAMIARHAASSGVPETLIRRVIKRESGYNPRASHAGNLGLMQIRHATARGMGYGGSAGGLLDAETNLAYAVPYLAGAYRVAGGNHDRAVRLYSSGYYYAAKRKGISTRVAVARPAPAVAEALPPGVTFSLASFTSKP